MWLKMTLVSVGAAPRGSITRRRTLTIARSPKSFATSRTVHALSAKGWVDIHLIEEPRSSRGLAGEALDALRQ